MLGRQLVVYDSRWSTITRWIRCAQWMLESVWIRELHSFSHPLCLWEGSRNTSRLSAIFYRLADSTPRRDKSGLRYDHTTWSLVDNWACFRVGVASRSRLANVSWPYSGLVAEIIVAKTSLLGKAKSHSGFYEFHICALCRKASCRKLFANIQYLPLEFDIALCQPSLKGRNKDRLKNWQLCDVWKLPLVIKKW